MQDDKRQARSGVEKLGIKDVAAIAAGLAGSLSLCALMQLLPW